MKKVKDTKKCVIKRKLEFEDYKLCLQAAQLHTRINQLEKNKPNVESLRVTHEEFIKKICCEKQCIY